MLETIKTRRSIRTYTSEPVDNPVIDQIIEMGTWAPSGLNNQPWKFVVVKDRAILDKIAEQTSYSKIIKGAPVCIAVFLDQDLIYDRVKDILSIGACIENMMLAIHTLRLGGVWLGEILKNRKNVEKILGVPETCELMAVIALGHPDEQKGGGTRKPLSDVVIGRK